MRAQFVWIGIVVSLLVGSVVTQGVLLVASMSDPSFAVEPDYERKAADWDAIQRRKQESLRLGWTVDLRTSPSERAGEVNVELSVFDRFGKPIRDATVALKTFHNARAGNVIAGRLFHDADGIYLATLPMRRSGIWEFRLEVVQGESHYTDVVRKSVLSAPRERG